jgi:ubiquinone biosynthesis protein
MDVAARLARALLAIPALSRDKDAIFHADPHAGNILYDKRSNELVILDWALTDRLTRKQRKSVVLLVLTTILRDADGMAKAIQDLCEFPRGDRAQVLQARRHIDQLLDALPLRQMPGPMDAMRLLDKIALEGVRFPAALLMFRKAAFTLEGVVEDVAGGSVRLNSLIANHTLANWNDTVACLVRLLSMRDWMALEWSALTFTSRLGVRAIFHPWQWLPGFSANTDALSESA